VLHACISSTHASPLSCGSVQVAGLSWIEKRACAAIFGEPPSATYEETLDQFFKAEELGCPWKSNPFFIAKVHLQHSPIACPVCCLLAARRLVAAAGRTYALHQGAVA